MQRYESGDVELCREDVRAADGYVPCRMAILGPSPPYEYPVDDLVERVEKVVANMVKSMTKSSNIERWNKQTNRSSDKTRQNAYRNCATSSSEANRHVEAHVAIPNQTQLKQANQDEVKPAIFP